MNYLLAMPSMSELLVVLLIALVLFGGATKIPQIMGSFGKGIRAFKKSLNEDDVDEKSSKQLEPNKNV